MKFLRPMLAIVAVVALVSIALACSAATPPTPSPTTAVDLDAEAQAAAAVLDQAVAAYEAGNTQMAMDLVADAYENHFELIEHPLEEVDAEFMEELETLIATRIRAAMSEGAPVDAVRLLVTEAKAGLEQARQMLAPEPLPEDGERDPETWELLSDQRWRGEWAPRTDSANFFPIDPMRMLNRLHPISKDDFQWLLILRTMPSRPASLRRSSK